MPSKIPFVELNVIVFSFTSSTLPSLPLPSPKSILPKLKEALLTSELISSLSKLTNAPSLFADARSALSEISIVPYKFFKVATNCTYSPPPEVGRSPVSEPAPMPPLTPTRTVFLTSLPTTFAVVRWICASKGLIFKLSASVIASR